MLYYNQGRQIRLAHRLCIDVQYFFHIPHLGNKVLAISVKRSNLRLFLMWELTLPFDASNGPFKAQWTQVIESQVILCLHYIVICTTGGGSSVRWKNFRCSAKTVHFSCKIYIFRGDISSKNLVCGAKNDKYEVRIRYQVQLCLMKICPFRPLCKF